jgi:hypothetical protein
VRVSSVKVLCYMDGLIAMNVLALCVYKMCDWRIRLSFLLPFRFLFVQIGMCSVPLSLALTGACFSLGVARGAKRYAIRRRGKMSRAVDISGMM